VKALRLAAAIALAFAMGVGLLVAAATPASAHGGAQDEPPTNYRADITAFDPGAPEVSLRIVEATSRFELTNRGPSTVVVMGYDGDQYLRIGPDGVFENERSGAVAINANPTGSGLTPPDVDPEAPPQWRQISTEPIAVWHDHRTHWMAPTEAVVARDPGASHIVNERWVVPVLVDGRPVEATGTITWIPAPNPLLWLGGIVLVAVLGIAASASRQWRFVVAAAAVLLLAVCTVDAVSAWQLSTAPTAGRASALVVPAFAIAAVVAGLALLPSRRHEGTAVLLLGGGGAALALLFGWVSRDYLAYSQVPSAFSMVVARLTVAGALSLGAILFGAMLVQRRRELAFLIKPHPRPRAPRSGAPHPHVPPAA
jgi:hypothetical protein